MILPQTGFWNQRWCYLNTTDVDDKLDLGWGLHWGVHLIMIMENTVP